MAESLLQACLSASMRHAEWAAFSAVAASAADGLLPQFKRPFDTLTPAEQSAYLDALELCMQGTPEQDALLAALDGQIDAATASLPHAQKSVLVHEAKAALEANMPCVATLDGIPLECVEISPAVRPLLWTKHLTLSADLAAAVADRPVVEPSLDSPSSDERLALCEIVCGDVCADAPLVPAADLLRLCDTLKVVLKESKNDISPDTVEDWMYAITPVLAVFNGSPEEAVSAIPCAAALTLQLLQKPEDLVSQISSLLQSLDPALCEHVQKVWSRAPPSEAASDDVIESFCAMVFGSALSRLFAGCTPLPTCLLVLDCCIAAQTLFWEALTDLSVALLLCCRADVLRAWSIPAASSAFASGCAFLSADVLRPLYQRVLSGEAFTAHLKLAPHPPASGLPSHARSSLAAVRMSLARRSVPAAASVLLSFADTPARTPLQLHRDPSPQSSKPDPAAERARSSASGATGGSGARSDAGSGSGKSADSPLSRVASAMSDVTAAGGALSPQNSSTSMHAPSAVHPLPGPPTVDSAGALTALLSALRLVTDNVENVLLGDVTVEAVLREQVLAEHAVYTAMCTRVQTKVFGMAFDEDMIDSMDAKRKATLQKKTEQYKQELAREWSRLHA